MRDIDGGGVFDAAMPALDGGPDAMPAIPPAPQVLDLGGPRLTRPTVIPVTYAGDELADEVEDFVASVGCSDYWHSVTTEYGIGDAVTGPPVRLSEAAPSTIDDSTIAAFLVHAIEAGDPRFPRPDSQTLFVFLYPTSTTVTDEEGE